MQDLRKNKRKMINKQMNMVNNSKKEEISEELDRAYRPKHNNVNDCSNTCNDDCNNHHNDYDYHDDCKCDYNDEYDKCKPYEHHHEHHHHEHDKCKPCEPCQVESDMCVDNPCADTGCCNPISPAKFSTNNSVPVAIETNRIFDSIVFQTFTDATSNEGTLVYDIEVVEVNGPVPRTGPVNITIEKVCMNFSSIEIETDDPLLEDFNVVRISPANDICDTTFEYSVCGDRNSSCCNQRKGQSVAYKQKGLVAIVNDLVLELRGKCGCTEIVALAYPAVRGCNNCLNRVDEVQFPFNTLSASLCLPASGRQVTLRQDYQVSLTVDCIGKATLSVVDVSNCECYFNLAIPNGIDVILCLQEVVSILVSEQIVVLASPTSIQPRVVDTFANVCDFNQCPGDLATANANNTDTNNTNACNTCIPSTKTYKKGCNSCC